MVVVATVLGVLAALLIGVVGGIFVAFSVSVMPALDRVQAERAVQVMRTINQVILNPLFLSCFLGALIVPAGAAVFAFLADQASAGWLFVVATVVYLVGSFGVTAGINVPLNNQLENDGDPADDPEGRPQHRWANFAPRWTRWNTMRSLACVASLGLQVGGLVALT